MLQTPDGILTGEVMDGPQGPGDRSTGRQSCFQEPNRQWQHLAAKHQDWANQMVGEALYQQTLMILRNLRNDSNGRKTNSRRWVGSECGIHVGEIGEDRETISVTQWWMGLKDAFLKHFLVISFGIFEILMGHNREEGNPRMQPIVGSEGNTGNVAAINVMVDAIEGIVGCRSMVESNEDLAESGLLTEMQVPDYGYVRSSLILHEGMDFDLYNDWAGGDLNELTYTDRHGGKRPLISFICRKQRCACRYHMRYTRG